jgi:hypothetical protein
MNKKFAFLVHDPVMLVHYKDVWKALGSDNFLIITTEYFARDNKGNERLGLSSFLNQVLTEGYEVRAISEIISNGTKIEYVITNHAISGSTKEVQSKSTYYFKKVINRILLLIGKAPLWGLTADISTYLPLQVGKKQIRYMYGADISDGWSLQSWNEIYDVFLCHGVNDERELNKRFKGKTFIMGYPRYDRFFSEDIDLKTIKDEFAIDGTKKTILWMPTLGGEYSSIPIFAEPLSRLINKYNIIVRPHPLSFVQEKDFIVLLEKFNFNLDRVALRDMNELFSIADVILADNGGTPFSAIFLKKNVIFLGTDDSNLDHNSLTGSILADSSVMELKEHLPVITPQETSRLESMLESESFYKENDAIVEMLFKKYFDSPRGGGAQRVAEYLKTL